MRYHIYEVFTIWTLVTLVQPTTSPKVIGFFNSILGIHRPLIQFLNVNLNELPCFKELYKVFTILPPLTSDNHWPLPRKIKGNLHILLSRMKIIHGSYPWKLHLQAFCFWTLETSDDLWPSPWVCPLSMKHLCWVWKK